MIEKIFDRSRRWKEFMIEKLDLPASFMQTGFAEIISKSSISPERWLTLCIQSSKAIGPYSYEDINYLHTLKGYRAVLEIMCDDQIVPRGNIFWLKHPEYPEIVFETLPAPMELYKVYVIDEKIAADRKPGDSILLSVSNLGRVADVAFVSEVPAETEAKRQAWLARQ